MTYVDRETFDYKQLSEEIDIAFHKPKEYAAEKEYRFAIDTFTQGPDPVTLDIGTIDDISIQVDRTDLNRVISGSIGLAATTLRATGPSNS